jgi:hypothetical protein
VTSKYVTFPKIVQKCGGRTRLGRCAQTAPWTLGVGDPDEMEVGEHARGSPGRSSVSDEIREDQVLCCCHTGGTCWNPQADCY